MCSSITQQEYWPEYFYPLYWFPTWFKERYLIVIHYAKLQYGAGGFCILGSVPIIVFFFVLQFNLGHWALATYSLSVYFLTSLWYNMKTYLVENHVYVLGYLVVSGAISFAVCYRMVRKSKQIKSNCVSSGVLESATPFLMTSINGKLHFQYLGTRGKYPNHQFNTMDASIFCSGLNLLIKLSPSSQPHYCLRNSFVVFGSGQL